MASFTSATVEQAALAFVPVARNAWQQRSTIALILAMGAADGVLFGAICLLVPHFQPQLFTPDAAVWPWMRSISPQALIAMVFCGVDIASTACLVARRDLAYVARSFVITLAGLAAYMTWCSSAFAHDMLAGVWWGIVAFFALRTLQSLLRLLYITWWGSEQRPTALGGPPQEPAAA